MNDHRQRQDVPARLREGDDAGARALIEASDVLRVPSTTQQRVRQAIDERVFAPSARPRGLPRWAVATVSVLLVGTALAAGLARLWPADEPPAPRQAPPPRPSASLQPAVNREPAAPVPPLTVPARRVVVVRARPVTAPPVTIPDRPRVVRDWPLPEAEPASAPTTNPPAPAPIVSIDWHGRRRATLALAESSKGHTLVGTVNGTRVSLTIEKAIITGHIGEHPVNLLIKGEQAVGTIRGHDSLFVVSPIAKGHLVRGEVPGHGVRVEQADEGLRWYPGCEAFLVRIDDEHYSGQCEGGEQAHVQLPVAFSKLHYVVRFVLLGMLLPERDPVFDHDPERMFPPLP